jgi:2-C-methyl-D-erythritol 4-phosphate cytidylyltransferase/2-C-methyl-D-erythritol 2,4-cyclodiphosphate synthase
MQKTNLASVIVVAAGKGKRFSEDENKVMADFNGLPIFEYSLETFQKSELIGEIILVGPCFLNHEQLKKNYPKLTQLVGGGDFRQQSVFNGLKLTNVIFPYVFIHDAARPFFSSQILNDMAKMIDSCDGVIPLLPLYDALKEKIGNGEIIPLLSKNLFRTQTPQLYKRQLLWDAFQSKKESLSQYRDEMELARAFKEDILIKSVKGSYFTEKITTQEEWFLLKKLMPKIIKTGIGYDFHPFITDRPLILGGCHIPFSLGLEGDSDGDVLSHAILDSILGALSLGDIGRYIGIKTPNAMKAISLTFLKQLMNDKNITTFQILHLDVTLVCKEPLLNPWIEKMTKELAKTLKINYHDINLKSTTDKGVDGAGEGKGIRAISIATVEMFQRRDEWQMN